MCGIVVHDSCWQLRLGLRTAQPLEGYGAHEWVCFERALVVRDIYTGGGRTFLSMADAQAFRASLYAQYGEALPALGGGGGWDLVLARVPTSNPASMCCTGGHPVRLAFRP